MHIKQTMKKDDRIFVAGATGLVGSSIVRKLKSEGYINILTPSHNELDLSKQSSVNSFFEREKPDHVFLAAAKVGGIQANREALDEFLYVNTLIEFNTIMAAFNSGVKKFCFLGSSCIYPRECPQPIKEEYLLSSALEITNEGYALAKISGLKLCEYLNTHYPDRTDYISAMPCNLYGPGDNYHPEHSHVIPALIRRFHEAKISGMEKVKMWGTGKAIREFLHVDDVADACFFLMQNYSGESSNSPYIPGTSWINVGSGQEVTMKELGTIIASVIGFKGEIEFDATYPDGTPRKLLDSSKIFKLGWTPTISFQEGLTSTYNDYLLHKDDYRS